MVEEQGRKRIKFGVIFISFQKMSESTLFLPIVVRLNGHSIFQMGLVQKDAFRTMIISYLGIVLGYINKVVLFLLILTTEQIGLVNLLVTVGTLFAQFANFGASFTVWKFLPFFRNHEKRHHGFFPFVLLIVFAGIACCTIVSFVFREDIEAMYLEKSPLFSVYYIWMIPIGIAYVLFMVVESFLRSFYHNVIAVVAYELILRLAVAATLFLIWFDWISFDSFVILNSLIYLIPTLILLVYLNRIGELNLEFRKLVIPKRFRKIIFQFSSFYYINALGIVLVNSIDVLMIGQMTNNGLVGVGVYTTVVFVTSALQVPFRSIVRISMPLVADYWKQRDFDQLKELYRKVSSVSLVVGLGMFILFWVNVDFLFSFLRPEFQAGIWTFFFLMLGKLVDMYCGLNGPIFTTSKKFRYDLIFTVFLIGAVFFLNLLFIPKWGIAGAAISTSFALVVYNVGRVIFVWYIYKIHFFERNQFWVIALGVGTLLLNAWLPNLFANKWLEMVFDTAFAGALFFLPILVFKLEPETINYLNKGWKFIKSKLASEPPVELP